MSNKRLGRRSGTVPQRKRFLIISEGAVTEKEYLNAITSALKFAGSQIVFSGPGPTSPREIVETAKRKRNSQKRGERFDEVWCVFDIETKVDQLHREGLLEAIDMASANRIKLALSNPCFELWVYLHEEINYAPMTTKIVQSRCRNLMLIVDDKHLADATALVGLYAEARNRAVRLGEAQDNQGNKHWKDRNPSSSFYCLVDGLRESFEKR